jgi:hypothetical protein
VACGQIVNIGFKLKPNVSFFQSIVQNWQVLGPPMNASFFPKAEEMSVFKLIHA